MNEDERMALSDIDIRDAFFDALYQIAKNDPKVIFLTADMSAHSLVRFKKDLPQQYINVGVAEQNMVSVAAGLALGGKRVFIYAIASFITQRCYEQIKVDVCGMALPITVIGVGPGIAYNSDGPTHHAIHDIAIMRVLPEITILSPADSIAASRFAQQAYTSDGPIYVRLDKGLWPVLYDHEYDFSSGIAHVKEGNSVLIIATGSMVHQAHQTASALARDGIDAGIIDMYRIKPLNKQELLHYVAQYKSIVTLEEHSMSGGIGSIISELLTDTKKSIPLKRIALADLKYNGYGDRSWMHSLYGLDVTSITKTIRAWLEEM
ncbi:MAG: 1-deoxy-D-xylulose-5-phosphate synthase [Candidatus Omnitrophica bacterium]|nr:1-deoxy-D-xylulose-5-phosphate synthase [Candidatus Omnitrophota bacterium]